MSSERLFTTDYSAIPRKKIELKRKDATNAEYTEHGRPASQKKWMRVSLLFLWKICITNDLLFLPFGKFEGGCRAAPIMCDIGHKDIAVQYHPLIPFGDGEAFRDFFQRWIGRRVIVDGDYFPVQIGQDKNRSNLGVFRFLFPPKTRVIVTRSCKT